MGQFLNPTVGNEVLVGVVHFDLEGSRTPVLQLIRKHDPDCRRIGMLTSTPNEKCKFEKLMDAFVVLSQKNASAV